MPRLLLAIAAGGALGSVARYGVALLAQRAHASFPYGTLVVNVAGSLLLGVLVRSFASHSSGPTVTQLALTIGLCGGFTTFSTFSLDTLRLLQSGEHGRAAAYVAASVGLSVTAVWLGFLLAARTAR
jgi:CrcB protein